MGIPRSGTVVKEGQPVGSTGVEPTGETTGRTTCYGVFEWYLQLTLPSRPKPENVSSPTIAWTSPER